jgi:hypothetical protein
MSNSKRHDYQAWMTVLAECAMRVGLMGEALRRLMLRLQQQDLRVRVAMASEAVDEAPSYPR